MLAMMPRSSRSINEDDQPQLQQNSAPAAGGSWQINLIGLHRSDGGLCGDCKAELPEVNRLA
ncbi:MAG: hypothetical protein AW10_02048 [Candidatus Accumulibacter appositus]|uniref:Uncharacterized protein n=1 Tax=Candidatus Accumulibacter appositus TaxID=1454003 RepID=A0A011QMJ4_9PROT|nr:MAG: hypothetical protein AW10_02048 [Candidatus Accumulibacter appositus]